MSEVSAIEGRVKWFNDSKGYGWLTVEGQGDVFVHYSEIVADGYRSLDEGQSVRFELQDGPRGLFAARVVALTPSTRTQRGAR